MNLSNIFFYLMICFCICDENIDKNTKSLPYFRKQVEELPLVDTYKPVGDTNNLVSFVVKNAKEIFLEFDDTTLDRKSNIKLDETTIFPSTLTSRTENIDENLHMNMEEKDLEENLLEKTKVATAENIISTKLAVKSTDNTEFLELAKDLAIIQREEQEERGSRAVKSIHSSILKPSLPEIHLDSSNRSCITCDNVASIECNNPQNKLVSSNVCEQNENLCYSQHTPFGIVDRGCFSVNNNLSTFVCSCNLCNYISISEMPYIFSSKKNWIENVIELSRTRLLRRSIYKDMSCLKCEVNTTMKTGDMLDNANCLEGNVGTLPIQECAENEICGVKAIKSEGYIWRGCLGSPLYNYWWALCDSDLCNYDSLVSIYDEF